MIIMCHILMYLGESDSKLKKTPRAANEAIMTVKAVEWRWIRHTPVNEKDACMVADALFLFD